MTITLEELSGQLEISPSGLRKRIHSLGLPIEKGSRGKWLIPDDLLETLKEADRLMKDGAGANTTRRVLGLSAHSPIPDVTAGGDTPLTDHALGGVTGEGALTDRGAGESPVSERSLTGAELHQALDLLAAERARSEALQAQLIEALDELGDVKAKVGMFQERSLNLAETVTRLEGKVLMLEAPQEAIVARPWWKLWG